MSYYSEANIENPVEERNIETKIIDQRLGRYLRECEQYIVVGSTNDFSPFIEEWDEIGEMSAFCKKGRGVELGHLAALVWELTGGLVVEMSLEEASSEHIALTDFSLAHSS